ncbi:hypothetical protein F5887DRAFT_1059292 [Amanita rubescens]|nr:hypothetical protein F5887DRAFT_1059292 [Amanita rubescens]
MDLQSATTMPTTLRLNCLIEDEDKVFPVNAACNDEVSELKKLIQKERALGTLKGVDPHDLELWKPKELNLIAAKPSNILVDRIKHLDFSKFTDKLEAVDNVFDIFPPEPPKGYIHIIVKVPHTDLSPRLDHQQTKIKIADALAGFEKYFEYLATGELDAHLDSIRPEDKLIELGVDLPISPILLLHDLGKHLDQKRIEDLFKPNAYRMCTITHLFSVSGSGTASGSNDFTIATKMLKSMGSWCADPPDFSNNSTAAHRAFAMLLCARVVIFEQLVKQFPANTNITDARRRWVLAQVLPPCLVEQTQDLFVTVLRALRNADTDIMLQIVEDLRDDIMTTRKDLFPEGKRTPLFIVIDEAQVAANNLKCFPSTSGNGPILREMVQFFQSTVIFNKIILSGTGLSMGMVKDATGSLSAKAAPTRVQEVFSNVGCFTREDPSQEAYIRRYLTLSDNDISDKRLLERMKFWFSGRYRLTASLIEIFLHSEYVPRHRALTSFAECLTGFKITDAIDLEADQKLSTAY